MANRRLTSETPDRGPQQANAETNQKFETWSEDDLVKGARAGDKQALGELLNRSREGCLRIAIAILHNSADAQDAVQNAFCKAYTHIASFTQQSKFSSWVARIVVNECFMRCRIIRRVCILSYEAVAPDGEACLLDSPVDLDTPEGELGSAEIREMVRLELGRIPASLRVPLELRYLHDLAISDVARSLGASVCPTKSRLYRAHRYLRERMLRHCGNRGLGTLTRAC